MQVLQIQDEKLAVQLQCNDQLNDIQSLRKELLQAEQTRLDLEADKQTFSEKIRFLEIEKEKVNISLLDLLKLIFYR